MAKITKKEKEVVKEEVKVETIEVEALETVIPVEEEGIQIDTTQVAKQEKLVRIKVKEKFKCFIGEWYYFEKNKIYSVPEHVKNTLMQRGKLLPM